MKIIFKNKDNSIGIITPTDEALSFATVIQVAEKDVPHDLPYWMVEDSIIPEDRTFRSAWEIDESLGSPDGFGGESNEFDEDLLKAYYGELNDNSKDMLLESQRLIDGQKVLNDSIKTTITQIEELVK